MRRIEDHETISYLTALLHHTNLGQERQIIFYGPPGTGKSTQIKNILAENGIPDINTFRVTFHPDYEYSDFVGSYRPTIEGTDSDEKIKYKFIPGVFMNAYVQASQTSNPVVLIIEEISRGNCSAIFGDVFQLLDRDLNGVSEYDIDASEELRKFLADQPTVSNAAKLKLPANLYLLATMNTSDQSIFPMDSAFKRRWDWEYVPIDLADANQATIEVAGQHYLWGNFIEVINQKIYDITGSEDKQLGNRFVNHGHGIISQKTFLGKVMFYLWNDIFKHEDSNSDNNIFKFINSNGEEQPFRFTDLYSDPTEEIVTGFFNYNQISVVAPEDEEL